MIVTLNNGDETETHEVRESLLIEDIKKEYTDLESIELDAYGSLTLNLANNRWEYWVARPSGCGVGNSYWGDLPGGYEYCGSGGVRHD